MGEVKIPLSVIQTLLSNQNDFNQKLVEILSLHLKQSALAYERALNPPIQSIMPMDAPRMFKTEEEEDLEFAYRNDQITREQYDNEMQKMFDESPVYIDSD